MRTEARNRWREAAASLASAALLGLATTLVPGDAMADPAATGTFSIIFDGTGFGFSGSLSFDDQTFDVLGLSQVNLGTSLPGGTSLAGSVTGASGFPPDGAFSANLADTASGTELSLDVAGSYICWQSAGPGGSGVNCSQPSPDFVASYIGDVSNLAGSLVGGGAGTLPTGSGISYVLDGYTNCQSSGGRTIRCDGSFGLNAFGAVNTPVGTDVSVPFDTTFFNPVTGQTEPLGVEVVFTEVLSAGETTVTASSGAGGDLPPNVAVQFESWGAAFFDVTTNASVAPPIRVCASYPDATNDGMVDGTGPAPGEPDTIPECQVRLHHKELVPPGTEEEFVDKTLALGDALCPVETANACPGLCIDRTQNLVCGSVGELSTFGVFLQLVPEPVRLSIDVRPFSDANRINLRDPLPLPVAILGGETVDVTTIDATTLAFGPAGVAPKLPPGHPFDVNGDGHPDLVAVFAARDSGLQVGDTEACVSGEIEGLPFEGCDAVVVVNQIRCGLGGELALLLPPLWWLRARRRARRG